MKLYSRTTQQDYKEIQDDKATTRFPTNASVALTARPDVEKLSRQRSAPMSDRGRCLLA